MNPLFFVGSWGNVAELAVFTGLASYNITNTETPREIAPRKQNTNIDRQKRVAYIRRAMEEWKRAAGIDDTILNPGVGENFNSWWSENVYTSTTTVPFRTLISSVLGYVTLEWSWNVNRVQDGTASFTGVRTPPSLWKSDYSESLFTLPPKIEGYELQTQRGTWYHNHFTQVGHGADSTIIERHVMRIDFLRSHSDFSYIGWPNHEEVGALAVLVSSTAPIGLYEGAGWLHRFVRGAQAPWTWGWGATQRVRNWTDDSWATLVWNGLANTKLNATVLTPGIWLLRGTNIPELPSASRDYLHKVEGFPPLASYSDSGGGNTGLPYPRALPQIPGVPAPTIPGRQLAHVGPHDGGHRPGAVAEAKAAALSEGVKAMVLQTGPALKVGADPADAEFSHDHLAPVEAT